MSDTELPIQSPLEEHRFPCAQCGADYRFAPNEGKMICDHCGHSEDIATTSRRDKAIAELDYKKAIANQLPEQDIEVTRVTTCPNCAAQVAFDEKLHATECPFCATPVVTDTGTHRHIKPRALLPFVLNENAARTAMTSWLGRLWFAPKGLQDFARKGRKMQGIYVPYWTFDADTKSTYSGERGTVYHETRMVTRNGKQVQERVQKVRWSAVSGRVARWFDDVLVLASKSLPKRYTDALEPWDLSTLSPYQPEFLAGFRAEGYSVQLEEGFDEARRRMDQIIETDVKRDIGGDRQRVKNVHTSFNDVTFKHVLLPVWLAAYKYRGKTYRFVVNGQTGKVQGERPYSAAKIAIAVVIGVVIVVAVGYALSLQEAV